MSGDFLNVAWESKPTSDLFLTRASDTLKRVKQTVKENLKAQCDDRKQKYKRHAATSSAIHRKAQLP